MSKKTLYQYVITGTAADLDVVDAKLRALSDDLGQLGEIQVRRKKSYEEARRDLAERRALRASEREQRVKAREERDQARKAARAAKAPNVGPRPVID